jgi:hypothetical protein
VATTGRIGPNERAFPAATYRGLTPAQWRVAHERMHRANRIQGRPELLERPNAAALLDDAARVVDNLRTGTSRVLPRATQLCEAIRDARPLPSTLRNGAARVMAELLNQARRDLPYSAKGSVRPIAAKIQDTRLRTELATELARLVLGADHLDALGESRLDPEQGVPLGRLGILDERTGTHPELEQLLTRRWHFSKRSREVLASLPQLIERARRLELEAEYPAPQEVVDAQSWFRAAVPHVRKQVVQPKLKSGIPALDLAWPLNRATYLLRAFDALEAAMAIQEAAVQRGVTIRQPDSAKTSHAVGRSRGAQTRRSFAGQFCARTTRCGQRRRPGQPAAENGRGQAGLPGVRARCRCLKRTLGVGLASPSTISAFPA